jgi:uncharacterized protein (DUF3820 family)
MWQQDDLLHLVTTPMPFGKYQGRLLIDLPEAYLLWFRQQGWPAGQLGEWLALTLEIKINGLEDLLTPLRQGNKDGTIIMTTATEKPQ